jgi:CBS domain-containing protein
MLTAALLLKRKGDQVFTTTPDIPVFDALRLMAEKNIGALMVLHDEALVGIVSERDYARKVVLHEKTSRETPVREIMTSNPVTIGPATEIRECMRLMTDRQVRHLPVVEGKKLLGVVSIGDVVKGIIEDQEDSIHHLERYIIGR